uniref:Uncharacterized protein n=1 Tax=Romanomermis culicivorax TaxID=13658 RepID=A0A915K5Q1_ROMCU
MLLHAGMSPFIYLALDAKLRKYFCSQFVRLGKFGVGAARRPTSTTVSYDYELRAQGDAKTVTNISHRRTPDRVAVALEVTDRQLDITIDQDDVVHL